MSNRALSAVFQHSASRGAARLVLLAMADEASDAGELTAYRRSRSYLARKANVDESTVKRAVRDLVELGELEVLEVGDGRRQSNYRLLLQGLREGTEPYQPGATRPRDGGRPDPGGAQSDPPIIPFSPDPSPSDPNDSRSGQVLSAGFAEFWARYPRKDAKGDARKAWPAAVKAAGGVQPIVDGAARYAADPNRDARYTAYPATWLRRESWADGPLPPRNGPGTAAPGPRGGLDERRLEPGGRLVL